MTPFKLKTKTGHEKWYWFNGESLVTADSADVPARIQKENTEKLVRAIGRLQTDVSSLQR